MAIPATSGSSASVLENNLLLSEAQVRRGLLGLLLSRQGRSREPEGKYTRIMGLSNPQAFIECQPHDSYWGWMRS